MMGYQEVMAIKNLRDPDWNKHWDNQLELREDNPMESHMVLEMTSLEYQHWESHWRQDV